MYRTNERDLRNVTQQMNARKQQSYQHLFSSPHSLHGQLSRYRTSKAKHL